MTDRTTFRPGQQVKVFNLMTRAYDFTADFVGYVDGDHVQVDFKPYYPGGSCDYVTRHVMDVRG